MIVRTLKHTMWSDLLSTWYVHISHLYNTSPEHQEFFICDVGCCNVVQGNHELIVIADTCSFQHDPPRLIECPVRLFEVSRPLYPSYCTDRIMRATQKGELLESPDQEALELFVKALVEHYRCNTVVFAITDIQFFVIKSTYIEGVTDDYHDSNT